MADSKKMMDAIDRAIEDVQRTKSAQKDSSALVTAIQKELVSAIKPVMEAMVKDIGAALAKVKIEVPEIKIPPIEIPAFEMPEFKMPEIKLPTINVPAPQVTVNPQAVNIPAQIINEVGLRGVGNKSPLPVIMMGTDGKPLLMPMGGVGQGGSKSNFFTIKNILTELGNSVMDNTNNAIRTNVVAGTLSASQASGVADSVNVIQIGGNAVATDSGVTGTGVQRVVHVTDVAMSVNVTTFTASVAVSLQTDAGQSAMDELNDAARVNVVAADGTLTTRQVSGGADSVEINTQPISFEVRQTSGFSDSVNVVGFTASVAVVPTTAAGTDMTDETNDALRVNVVAGSLSSNTQYNDGATPDQAGGIGIISALFDGSSVQTASGSSYGVQQVQLSGFDGSLIGITANALDTHIKSQAAALEVIQVSGAVTSVNIVSGSTAGTQYNDGATPDQAGGVGTLSALFDGGSVQTLLGSSFGVQQVQLSGFDGSLIGITGTALDTSIRSQAASLETIQTSGFIDSVSVVGSVEVKQVSGFVDSVNVLQLGGTAIDTNLGDASAGTLRTVLAHSPNGSTFATTVGSDASTNVAVTIVGRKSIVVSHNAAGTLYVATGTASSTASFPLKQNQSISFDDYVGPINAIAEESGAGTISVRVIEIA